MSTKSRSIRLEEETSDAVNRLAELCKRDASFIMKEAVEEYVAHHSWILEETQRRLDLARAGKLGVLTEEETEREFAQILGEEH